MAKTVTEISAPQEITALVGAKTTVFNAGSSVVIITDAETNQALADLSPTAKRNILACLYGLSPGESKSLTAGAYTVDFQSPSGRSAVVLSDKK